MLTRLVNMNREHQGINKLSSADIINANRPRVN